MARIYAGANSNTLIRTPHFAERPLKELLDLLKISRSEKWSRSGPITAEKSATGEAFVQIEVERNEGDELGWNDGWHLVPLTANEAKNRLTLIHQ
jgi:hypothetical protein